MSWFRQARAAHTHFPSPSPHGEGQGWGLPRSERPDSSLTKSQIFTETPPTQPPPEGGRGKNLPRRTLLLSLAALGGCGFRPLYGGGTGSGPGTLLGKVRIIAGRGELPFRLREALIENMRPAPAPAPLTLTVTAKVTRDGILIEEDDEITRYNLTLDVDYVLRRRGETTVLYTGEARTIAAFNATASQYATLVSEREVQARAAEDVADKITRRLAAAYDPAWLG